MAEGVLERILCVEDDPDIQMIAQMALQEVGGFTVKLCASGEEALAEVEGFAPDLMMLDVMMPGMDGPTLLKRLRERPESAAVPAIFLTAKAQSHEVAAYKAMGALGVITKPFDPMSLSALVRDLWDARGGR